MRGSCAICASRCVAIYRHKGPSEVEREERSSAARDCRRSTVAGARRGQTAFVRSLARAFARPLHARRALGAPAMRPSPALAVRRSLWKGESLLPRSRRNARCFMRLSAAVRIAKALCCCVLCTQRLRTSRAPVANSPGPHFVALPGFAAAKRDGTPIVTSARQCQVRDPMNRSCGRAMISNRSDHSLELTTTDHPELRRFERACTQRQDAQARANTRGARRLAFRRSRAHSQGASGYRASLCSYS